MDPAQSYYAGISYRSGTDYFNASTPAGPSTRAPDAKCLDSTQAWFCRDLWIYKAKEGMRASVVQSDAGKIAGEGVQNKRVQKREPQGIDERLGYEEEGQEGVVLEGEPLGLRVGGDGGAMAEPQDEMDANVGSDFDASDLPADPPPPATEEEEDEQSGGRTNVPNAVFQSAKIMVNPRCVTTYAGVSHTQLALDLFGPPDGDEDDEGALASAGRRRERGMDVLEKWESSPETFVCQEQQ